MSTRLKSITVNVGGKPTRIKVGYRIYWLQAWSCGDGCCSERNGYRATVEHIYDTHISTSEGRVHLNDPDYEIMRVEKPD